MCCVSNPKYKNLLHKTHYTCCPSMKISYPDKLILRLCPAVRTKRSCNAMPYNTCREYITYRVIFLTGPPLKVQSTKKLI